MALLPNSSQAIVEPEKISGYLLNGAHPVGGPKARFFKSYGFSSARPDELAHSLLDHAEMFDAIPMPPTAHGRKYEISGPLAAPDGRMPRVKAVWIIDAGQTLPRLVTAVPD